MSSDDKDIGVQESISISDDTPQIYKAGRRGAVPRSDQRPPADHTPLIPKESFLLKCVALVMMLAHLLVVCLLTAKARSFARLLHIFNSVVPLLAYATLLTFWEDLILNLRQLGRIACGGVSFWAYHKYTAEHQVPGPIWDDGCQRAHRTLGCVRYVWNYSSVTYIILGVCEWAIVLCILVARPLLMIRYSPMWGVPLCTFLAIISSSVSVLQLGGSCGLVMTNCVLTTLAHMPVGSPWWHELLSTSPGTLIGVFALCVICVVFDTFCVLERNMDAAFRIVCTLVLCLSAVGSNFIAVYTRDLSIPPPSALITR